MSDEIQNLEPEVVNNERANELSGMRNTDDIVTALIGTEDSSNDDGNDGAEGEVAGINARAEPETTGSETEDSVTIPTEIEIERDGQISRVSLDDLRKSYVELEVVRQKEQALSAKQQELANQQQQYSAALNQAIALATADPVIQRYESMTDQDRLNLVNTDAHEFLLLQQTYFAKKNHIAKLAEENKKAAETAWFERRNAMAAELPTRIPEWKDREIATKELGAIDNYGLTRGFTKEELGSVSDTRFVQVLRDAMLWNTYQSQLKDAETKKVETQSNKSPVLKARSSTPTKSTKSASEIVRRANSGNLRGDALVDALSRL